MGYKTQSKEEDLALRKILEGTASHTGREFFRALVKNLAEALGTKGAWVTEFTPGRCSMRAISFWVEDHFVDDYEFQLQDSPCERVLKERQLFHVRDNILNLFPKDPDLKNIGASSYLGMPLFDTDGSILGNLAVLDTRPMPEEARNVALFKIFADRAASELRRLNAENRLYERTKELQKEYSRKSAELEDARNMQLNMLPKSDPYCPGYQFSFSMKTASEVGGDYYDYRVSDDGALTFGIGDATGHGLQASVMVTAMKLLFSEHAAETDIIEFLKKSSNSISLMDFRKIYMAFAIGRLENHTLEIAGAGMPPALIFRNRNNTLEKIKLNGLPLGSRTSYPYKRYTTQIEPGDAVILMTDGLPESFNGDGEMLGYDRVSELILETAEKSPSDILDQLLGASQDWLRGSLQNDDMTFFIFRRKTAKDTDAGSKIFVPESFSQEKNAEVILSGS